MLWRSLVGMTFLLRMQKGNCFYAVRIHDNEVLFTAYAEGNPLICSALSEIPIVQIALIRPQTVMPKLRTPEFANALTSVEIFSFDHPIITG